MPLLSFLANALLGRFLSVYSQRLGSAASIFCPLYFHFFNFSESFFPILLVTSFCFIGLELDGPFFEAVALIMLIVVYAISSFRRVHSTEYVETDPHQARFMSNT